LFAFNLFVSIHNTKIEMMKAGFTGQGGWEFEFALPIDGLAHMFTGLEGSHLTPCCRLTPKSPEFETV
jgi:hypothetical protein